MSLRYRAPPSFSRRFPVGAAIPEVKLVADLLVCQNVAEQTVVVEERIILADRQHDLDLA